MFETQTSPSSGENSVHTNRRGHKHGLFSVTCFLLLARVEVPPQGGFRLYPWHPNAHRSLESQGSSESDGPVLCRQRKVGSVEALR